MLEQFHDRLRIDFLTRRDSIKNDDDAARILGITDFASAEQVHSNLTTIVREPLRRAAGADGLITDTRNLTLLIRIADCQAFVMYDAKKNIVGNLHAGWRGVLCGAIPAFFEVLRNEWQSDPADLFVWAAPSLCKKCAQFRDPVEELPGLDPRFFEGRHVDLQGIADQQLADEGVRRDHMERSPDCPKCRPDLYWSYREGNPEAVREGYRNVVACTLL